MTKYIEDIANEYNTRKIMKRDLPERLDKLKLLELPEQRSQEWYEIRNKVMNSSRKLEYNLYNCLISLFNIIL